MDDLLDYDVILLTIVKSISIPDLYNIYISDNINSNTQNCINNTKLFYMFGLNFNKIRMSLIDHHIVSELCIEYKVPIVISFTQFLNNFDDKYLFTEHVNTNYRIQRYNSNLYNRPLTKILQCAGKIEDYILIDRILDNEYLWCSSEHIYALGKGMINNIEKFGRYYTKLEQLNLLHSKTRTHRTSEVMEWLGLYAFKKNKEDIFLKIASDRVNIYTWFRNNPSLYEHIVGNEYYNLLKYFDVGRYMRNGQGIGVEISASYCNNVKLLKDSLNNISSPPDCVKGARCDRKSLVNAAIRQDSIDILEYLECTEDEVIKEFIDGSIIHNSFCKKIIEKYITIDKFQDLIIRGMDHGALINNDVLKYCIENDYYIYDECYNEVYVVYPELIYNSDRKINYIDLLNIIINEQYPIYSPYPLRLILNKVDIISCQLLNRIIKYVDGDNDMKEWIESTFDCTNYIPYFHGTIKRRV